MAVLIKPVASRQIEWLKPANCELIPVQIRWFPQEVQKIFREKKPSELTHVTTGARLCWATKNNLSRICWLSPPMQQFDGQATNDAHRSAKIMHRLPWVFHTGQPPPSELTGGFSPSRLVQCTKWDHDHAKLVRVQTSCWMQGFRLAICTANSILGLHQAQYKVRWHWSSCCFLALVQDGPEWKFCLF